MKNFKNILKVSVITLGFFVVALTFSFLFSINTASASTTFTCNSALLEGDLTVTPTGVQTSVWFEYGTSATFGNNTAQQTITSTGNVQVFNQAVSNLLPSTQYFYRAMGQNTGGSITGQTLSFTTPSCGGTNNSQPTVFTNSPTSVAQTNATLQGTANGNGQTTNAWFEWGTTSSFGNSTSQSFIGTGTQNYNYYLGGLNANTTYYYRAVAQNPSGTVFGATQNFTTLAGTGTNTNNSQPTVFTNAPTNISQTSGTLQGTANGNGQTTNAWFEYGTTASFGNSTSQSFIGTGTQNYNYFLSGLTANTTYYYRAVAQNPSGTVYGTTQSFTTNTSTTNTNTNNQQPSVFTNSPTGVAQTYATLQGTANGNGQSTNAWFEWGTTSAFGNTTSQSSTGTGSQNYSYYLSGLTANTTYYYRAVAQNPSGTVYGATQSFVASTVGGTTNTGQCYVNGVYQNCNNNSNQPYVTTYSPNGVGDTFATINGYIDPNGMVTTRWFEWGTSNGYLGNQTIKINQGLSAGPYNQSLTALQPNTTYYYRAVAQGPNGQVYGNILTFTTTGGGTNTTTTLNTTGCYVNGSYTTNCTGTNSLGAVTLLATNIGQTSGRVNGIALINQSAYTNGYFEWSTNSTLSGANTTPAQGLGTNPSTSFYASLFGLQPNTRYYYRAVASNSYGIAKGDILSFVTGGTTSTVNTNTSTVVVNRSTTNTSNIIVRNSRSQPSLMALDINQDGICVLRGSIIEYTVNYKNTSDRTLSDVVLRVLLPQELSFNSSDRGSYSEKDTSIVLPLGNVASGEGGTMHVRAEVVRGAEIGKTIVVTAYLVDTDTITGAQEEVVAYSLNQICENKNGLAALSIFGGDGFLPNTLLGWLILILLILALILLARNFYGEKEKAR